MVTITKAEMYYASQLVFLLLSFGLCQYPMLMYYARRHEPRGMLLMDTAFLGFARLVPLAHSDEEAVHHLNDISEVCSTLTFLLQITIIRHDGNKKVKIKSLHYLTCLAEVLITVELGVIVLDLIEVFNPRIGNSVSEAFN